MPVPKKPDYEPIMHKMEAMAAGSIDGTSVEGTPVNVALIDPPSKRWIEFVAIIRDNKLSLPSATSSSSR